MKVSTVRKVQLHNSVIQVTVTLALVLSFGVSAFAFDGQRKGFVVGGGLGVSPQASIKGDGILFIGPDDVPFTADIDEKRAGVAADFLIGYAWDNANMIVLEVNAVSFKSEVFADNGGDNAEVSVGFGGVSWYHYFGPIGKSFYVNLGVGSYVFDLEDQSNIDPKFGGQIGAGYEFARHFQVGAAFAFGGTELGQNKFTHNQISILVSGVAF